MKVIPYLEKLLPKFKISWKEPDFLFFQRDKFTYTIRADGGLSSETIRKYAEEVMEYYGRHLLGWQDEELER